MTEEIIKAAIEEPGDIAEVIPGLARLMEQAVAAERERCAKIAEERAARMGSDYSEGASIAAAIAKEIRDGI